MRLAPLTVLIATGLQPVWAQEYSVTDIGASGDSNYAWSINQLGQVAGYSYFTDNQGYQIANGFFYDGSTVDYVGTPGGGTGSDLAGVNDLGEAVGKAWGDRGTALLRRANGHVTRLGTLGGSRSYARAINNLSQVVGTSKLEGDLQSRPFIWQDGAMEALPLLGGGQGTARWINNSGTIIGSSTTDTDGLQQFAVVWEGGTVTRLPPMDFNYSHIANYIHDDGTILGTVHLPSAPGEFTSRAAIWRNAELVEILGTLADGTPAEEIAASWASGMNSSGTIVGESTNPQNRFVPFVYRDGEMFDLEQLIPEPWTLIHLGPGAINDAGQIAVTGLLPGGTIRALLLTPVPSNCVADFNGDGMVNSLDIISYLNAFNANDPTADINQDGSVNSLDFLAFLNAFVEGC